MLTRKVGCPLICWQPFASNCYMVSSCLCFSASWAPPPRVRLTLCTWRILPGHPHFLPFSKKKEPQVRCTLSPKDTACPLVIVSTTHHKGSIKTQLYQNIQLCTLYRDHPDSFVWFEMCLDLSSWFHITALFLLFISLVTSRTNVG